MRQPINKSILINAEPSAVWNAITAPDLMKQWMGELEMDIEIITDWQEGSAFIVKGFHHVAFENKGRILHLLPEKIFSYNYLSSLSRLPDQPENYTTVEFKLEAIEEKTLLTITLSNFPTHEIFKHVEFYWNVTPELIRKLAEAKR